MKVGADIPEMIDGETVSPELRPLLTEVYTELQRKPVNRNTLKGALVDVLAFLSAPAGRTHANCTAADHFFSIGPASDLDLDHVPDEFTDIIADMGGALHDTVKAPSIAENFDSTPEMLLGRAEALGVGGGDPR